MWFYVVVIVIIVNDRVYCSAAAAAVCDVRGRPLLLMLVGGNSTLLHYQSDVRNKRSE